MTAAQSVRHAEADAPDALSALRAVAARVIPPLPVGVNSSYRVPARPSARDIVPPEGGRRADARTRGAGGWSA